MRIITNITVITKVNQGDESEGGTVPFPFYAL